MLRNGLAILVLCAACGADPEPVTPVTPGATTGDEPPPSDPGPVQAQPEPGYVLGTDPPPDVAAPPSNAEVTASGLASRVLRPGHGSAHPGPTSTVEVHYSGWTTDGALFDSSISRGEPISFGLHQVIRGWTEGVQLMVEGEIRRLWIPVELAYQNRPGRPAGMLVFDVELRRIVAP
jgi:peptidylprolyl isomerase